MTAMDVGQEAAPAPADRSWRAAGRDRVRLPLGLLLIALGLVLYFDLTTPLALSDEWMFRFPLQSLQSGQGFQLWPGVLPTSLVQLVTALPLLAADPRFWRLAEAPYLAVAAAATFGVAARLGCGRFWSAVAAALVTAAPVTLSVATGFTSDIAYLALLMLAAWLALGWVRSGRGLPALILVAGLATLQRQHGFAIALALTAALIATRDLDRRRLQGLAALWIVTIAALAAPFLTGIASSTMSGLGSGHGRLGPGLASVVATIVVAMPMLGMFFLPMLPALWRRDPRESGRGAGPVIAFSLAVVGVAGAAVFSILFEGDIWPGNVWGIWGLGPTHIGGQKPPLLPLPLYLALEAATVVSFALILGWRRGMWRPSLLGFEGAFLVALALAGMLPMPYTSPLDRYFIQVMAPLAPLLAMAAARGEAVHAVATTGATARAARTRGAVLALLGLGVAFYIVGEQDYQAWQGARDAAAKQAYQRIQPARVEAGYEAVATYAAVPDFLHTGQITIDPINLIPQNPIARLEFAGPDDPRPGASYSSLSPGRIVIECVKPVSTACPFEPR
jgi:hypothetical protein